MESLPYYCKSSKLCKQIKPSNPERPKPLRFLHHPWGHQSLAMILMHKGIFRSMSTRERFRRTQIQTQRKKGVNLTGIFESKTWPPIPRTSPIAPPTGVTPYQPSKRRKGKGNEKTSRKESEKKSTITFRFLVGELSSMIRIAIARKYLNRVESKPPWFQSLKFNFPVISRQSLLSVQNAELTRRVENGFL